MSSDSYGLPTHQERSAVTRDRVLDIACDLLAEVGWEQTSVSAIAARAQVSVGTLYKRFSNRERLLAAAQERLRDVVVRDLSAIPDSNPAQPLASFLLDAMSRTRAVLAQHQRIVRSMHAHALIDTAVADQAERMRRAGEDRTVRQVLRHPSVAFEAESAIRFVIRMLSKSELKIVLDGGDSDAARALRLEQQAALVLAYLEHLGWLRNERSVPPTGELE